MNYIIYTNSYNDKWESVGTFNTIYEALDWINTNHETFDEVKCGSGKGYEIRHDVK